MNKKSKFYKDVFESINKYTDLVLVNKNYYLDKDYVPKDLVQIDYEYTSLKYILADKTATKYFIMMSNAAKEEGLNIKVISAYRSYEYQDNLYNKYLLEEDKSVVDTYSARAGFSEHQTGLAFDIYNVIKSYTEFGTTKEYEWVKDNCYKYGFIIRYKFEFSNITGYKEEPWHIRYVGVNNATYIYNNNISLEEYILKNFNTYMY